MQICKRFTILFLAALSVLLLGPMNNTVEGQSRTIIIEPGTLNAVIDQVEGDFNTGGGALVSDTKYVLRRGGTYPYSRNFNGAFSLHIEAEDGEGARPLILPVNTGDEAPRMFRLQDADSLSLKYIGLDYPGFDSDGNHTDNAWLRVRSNYGKALAEDCVFNGNRLEICRMDGEHQTLRYKNCIIRNNYQLDKWDKGWGPINLHGNAQDSVIFEGNTMFNTTTHVVHGGSDTTGYLRISQNTFYNIGARAQAATYINPSRTIGAFDLGAATNLIIEDNIFYNVGFMGLKPGWSDSFFVFNWIPTDIAETVAFRNNNIYMDADLIETNPDTAEIVQLFNPELAAVLGDISASGNIEEMLAFTNAPSTDECKEAITRWFAAPDSAIFDVLRLDDSIETADVDFAYAGSLSPTAGTGGQPLGDPRWHDDVTTGVADKSPHLPTGFALRGNYPNPFNPTTTIQFDLHETSRVQLRVYNTLGRVVFETDEMTMTAGPGQEIHVDAANWATGVFFYKLSATGQNAKVVSATGRMMLMK